MSDVFISYASQDQEVADKIVNILENRKIRCWIAHRDVEAGHEYAVSIMRAIKNSKLCVLILSHESNASMHVRKEINSCVNHKVGIIPFKIADVTQHEWTEYYLGNTQWLNALTDPLEAHITKLADRIDNFIDKDSQPKDPSPKDPQPKDSSRKDATEKSVQGKTSGGDSNPDKFITRMAKYEELIELGYDAKKISIQLVENDYITFHGISEDNEGDVQQWTQFLQNSTETFQFLLNGENQIIGNWSILALNKQMFDEAKKGKLLEKNITYDKSEIIAFPDIYYGYMLAILLLPDYRTMQNYTKIINSFYSQLEVYAENGVFFREWCMNIFSQEVENLIKKMGFVYVCDNMKFGKIYHQAFMPLPKNALIDKFPKLKELYEKAAQ